jgi:hypothetical protein
MSVDRTGELNIQKLTLHARVVAQPAAAIEGGVVDQSEVIVVGDREDIGTHERETFNLVRDAGHCRQIDDERLGCNSDPWLAGFASVSSAVVVALGEGAATSQEVPRMFVAAQDREKYT